MTVSCFQAKVTKSNPTTGMGVLSIHAVDGLIVNWGGKTLRA
jgi:hypothetical protein